MSLREILERYAHGLPMEVGKIPIYNGEDADFPDPARLDLAEREELANAFQNELRAMSNIPAPELKQKTDEKSD